MSHRLYLPAFKFPSRDHRRDDSNVYALLCLGLRCYVCDSRSVIGYYDAEKDCNTERSLQQCPNVKVCPAPGCRDYYDPHTHG